MTWPADFPIYFGRGIPGPFGNSPAPTVSILVYDTFTDTNSVALTSHTPDKSPAPWVAIAGTMDIQSNKASWASGALNIQTINTGKADCTISCIVTTAGGIANDQNGISFRVIDTDNRWVAYLNNQGNTVNLLKFVTGTPTSGGSAAMTLANNTAYTVEVVLSGNSIIMNVDGVQKFSISDAAHATATRHGLYGQIAGHLFDEFQVV